MSSNRGTWEKVAQKVRIVKPPVKRLETVIRSLISAAHSRKLSRRGETCSSQVLVLGERKGEIRTRHMNRYRRGPPKFSFGGVHN